MAKKIKKYKVGIDSETFAISLVESPAIESDFIALSKEEPVKIQLSNDEKHILYGAALLPNKPIYRRNDNGDEFYIEFTAESIEKMSQEFFKEYRQHEMTLDHNSPANEVYVVESWIKTDMYKDKSVALGLDETLPVGAWFIGAKVNNVEVWDRIKNGELKGFSIEAMIDLEEFSKIEQNYNKDMEVDTNFWTKLKSILFEALGKKDENVNEIEPINEELEEQTPTIENNPTVEPSESVSEVNPDNTPSEENNEVVEEPVIENNEPETEVKEDEKPKVDNSHLEELINNLKNEIEALKDLNTGLQDKIKDLSKEPSTKPINVNSNVSNANNYSAWREQLRRYI